MKKLYILYDPTCGFCCKCSQWMKNQESYFDLEMIPAGSKKSIELFPKLDSHETKMDLTVVNDEGGVYQGAHAWIICLYALVEYRDWSYRLNSPSLWPLAKKAFEVLSQNRTNLSDFLGIGG